MLAVSLVVVACSSDSAVDTGPPAPEVDERVDNEEPEEEEPVIAEAEQSGAEVDDELEPDNEVAEEPEPEPEEAEPEPDEPEPEPSGETAAATTDSPTECGAGADLSEAVATKSFVSEAGIDREYLVSLPSGFVEGQSAPVVFNFHGAGSNASEQLFYGNFGALAEESGAIQVMPQALEVDGSVRWNPGLVGAGLDIDYVSELADIVRADYCTSGLFAAGMSSGGAMTSALACWTDSPFEGFGPVTLAFYADDLCSEAPARPFAYFHGTDDQTVPFEGDGDTLAPASVTAQAWADHNGCDPEPLEEAVGTEVTRFEWANCDAPTSFWVIDGGGHTWPGSLEVPDLGYVTSEIDASAIIWELFFG